MKEKIGLNIKVNLKFIISSRNFFGQATSPQICKSNSILYSLQTMSIFTKPPCLSFGYKKELFNLKRYRC